MAYKEDLRIVRTRKLLSNTLLGMMEEDSIEKISVIDLCAKAMVNRATFYAHFEDKYHLLSYALEELKDELYNEYLSLDISGRIVPSAEAAAAHINRYGSGHSDSIITRNPATAEYFLSAVDSATVYWNASTRFTDGGEFGMGAEIGISTDKLHARGPMGLKELTSYKYRIYGEGQIRS